MVNLLVIDEFTMKQQMDINYNYVGEQLQWVHLMGIGDGLL